MTSLGTQEEVVSFLRRQAAERGGGAAAETVQTHLSLIFLAGERAFKLKRAAELPYVDFSTPERRFNACAEELRLNRRTAPTLYVAVRRITREAEGLQFDGGGPLVDAVVEMKRFDQGSLFDALAGRQMVTPAHIDKLAASIAAFHTREPPDTTQGGAARVAHVLKINAAAMSGQALFAPRDVSALTASFDDDLAKHASLLDKRASQGWVRHCHGDLHLGNICLVDGDPTLFDCLEFSSELATSDVLYDLAFLLMDLWHRNLHDLANRLFNRYLDEIGQSGGLALLPMFMAMRAAVRAHVSAAQAHVAVDTASAETVAQKRRAAVEYFELARQLLVPVDPQLVAIGGLSGSGKSTLAHALAAEVGPAPGARVLSTDPIRKAMHGVSAAVRLPPAAYDPAVSVRVYDVQRREADAVIRQGHAAIVDAVFDQADERRWAADLAAQAGVPFTGLWLQARPDTLRERVAARVGDASDATPSIVDAQLARHLGPIAWHHIDADRDLAKTLAEAEGVLDAELGRVDET